MKNTLINASGLTKVYSNGTVDVNAVAGIDLEIEQGEFVVIMGASGSGKSTLLHLLSGLDSTTAGKIIINGNSITTMNEKESALFRRKNIGFIFQAYNLVPNLSILENILVPGFLVTKNRKELMEKAYGILEDVGIRDLASRMPSEVSGGQQQRAAIARALINSPKVIFADEPTGNLNSGSSDLILDTLAKINRNNQTIVMVTHHLKAACRGNKIYYIKDGKIDDIYTKTAQQTTETQNTPPASIAETQTQNTPPASIAETQAQNTPPASIAETQAQNTPPASIAETQAQNTPPASIAETQAQNTAPVSIDEQPQEDSPASINKTQAQEAAPSYIDETQLFAWLAQRGW
ncbi:MAG: ATP-binding cassette domain-containing protein [bacterium]|nr:ATP-binding cassette domain-containing protein [bacterium]